MEFKNTLLGKAYDTIFNSTEKKEYEAAVTKMVNAIKNQRTLYRKEIREWKLAKIAAQSPELPRRKLLIDLYNDILEDAFIYGRSETRKLRISNKEGVIINAKGEIDEEKSKLLRKAWFNKYIKYDVESIYFGYSLIYPKTLDEEGRIKDIDIVWRDHIVPETCEILINPWDRKGERFDEAPHKDWFIFINHEKFLGLLDKAAPLYIFKKHSWQNWDEFEERFSIPIRIAKYAGNDKRVKAEIDKWLKDLGSAAYARFPEGVEIDIIESKDRDSFNVFNEKRKACNEELATLFDGHFETAKDTGSRAKADAVINSTQDLVTMDDELRVLYNVNDLLLPLLRRLGYPFAEDDSFMWNENVQSTPKERLEIFEGVKRLGYKVKKEQIETELDVEIEETEPQDPPIPPDPNDPDAKVNFNQPHIHKGCGAPLASYRTLNLAIVAKLNPEEERLLRQIYEAPDTINWDYNEFMASHGKLVEGLYKGFGDVDFDFEAPDHKTMRHLLANIHRFGVDKTQKEILDLNAILKDPSVDSFSKFREQAKKLFPNYKDHWLKTEYDQALATSQMAGKYDEMMEDIDVAPYWRLSAIIDDGTTDICRSLDGKVFRKDNPNTWQFLPPNHWKCRSDAEDVLDDYDGEISSLEDAISGDPEGWERMKKSGHNVNWGDTKEVFSKTQSYLEGLAVEPQKVSSFNFAIFGLKKWTKIVNKPKLPKKAFDFGSYKDNNGMAVFEDKLKLPVWVPELLWNNADEGVRNTIKSIITNSDELYWTEEANGFVYKYIKYFKEASVMVKVFFTKNEPAIATFFNKVDDIEIERTGLLLYASQKSKE